MIVQVFYKSRSLYDKHRSEAHSSYEPTICPIGGCKNSDHNVPCEYNKNIDDDHGGDDEHDDDSDDKINFHTRAPLSSRLNRNEHSCLTN